MYHDRNFGKLSQINILERKLSKVIESGGGDVFAYEEGRFPYNYAWCDPYSVMIEYKMILAEYFMDILRLRSAK